MGFSFLSLALIRASLPDMPWRRLLDSVGYTIGFLIVILGRQQLFTESTLTAVLPLLMRRDRATLYALLRFWAVVLSANLAGSLIFAALITPRGNISRRGLSGVDRLRTRGGRWRFLVHSSCARYLPGGWWR